MRLRLRLRNFRPATCEPGHVSHSPLGAPLCRRPLPVRLLMRKVGSLGVESGPADDYNDGRDDHHHHRDGGDQGGRN